MPSTTSWIRLEPRCRDPEMSDGLQARVHDPLWALARQWQVGEFAGHDGGAPVSVRCRTEAAPVTAYRPGPRTGEADPAGEPYDSRVAPIEALIERDPVDLQADRRAAAEAGLHFLQLLRSHDLGEYIDAYLRRYRLESPVDEVDDDSRRFLQVVTGRVVDGARLHADLAPLPRHPDGTPVELPAEPAIAEADADAIRHMVAAWLHWFADVHGAPVASGSSWVPGRMEHRFTLSAASSEGPVILDAAEYPGHDLDWHAFDVAADGSLPAGNDDAEPSEIVRTTLAAPVRYRGMPKSRWWEFEDARTDFGAIEASTEDLASLLFIEFALVYGNDWFVMPLDLEVGSLCRIRSLVVTDTFGQRTVVRSHRDVDRTPSAWRMFDLDRRGDATSGQLLFLPPTLPASLRGPTLEEVVLRRDEMANIGWAIERIVPGAAGRPVNRAGQATAPTQEPEPDETGSKDVAPFAYRLSTGVPDHWIPLVPVRTGPGAIRLRRGGMLGGPPTPHQGAILDAPDLQLFEEEVPRSGARITRRYQYARWTDGSTHLWIARRKQLRGGEAWSGLRHDVVEPAASGQTHPTS